MKINKTQIQEWLKTRDYNKGVSIYAQYYPNKAAKMAGREKFLARKLFIKLCLLAGIDFQKAEAEIKSEQRSNALRLPEAKPAVKSQTPPKVAAKPKAPAPKTAPKPPPPPADKQDQATEPDLPPEIYKIKKEHQRLFTLRSQLAEERQAIPENNRPVNVKKRKVLSHSIQELSARIEDLFNAETAYFKNILNPDRKLPDMDVLFPNDKARKPETDIEKLKKQRSNLMKSNAKDDLMLRFQSTRKLKRSNPLPKGEKRTLIEKRIQERNQQIHEIELLIEKHNNG